MEKMSLEIEVKFTISGGTVPSKRFKFKSRYCRLRFIGVSEVIGIVPFIVLFLSEICCSRGNSLNMQLGIVDRKKLDPTEKFAKVAILHMDLGRGPLKL